MGIFGNGRLGMRCNIEGSSIYKIAVYFDENTATILDRAIMSNDEVKDLSDMSDNEIIDMLVAATKIGNELESMGYTVNR